ncbi:type II toxin-antitoxin system HipA family toxin [Aequorivita antarctica]|uniref:Type II toxin-antitoxin system HipA family toxin n=1 Tax=Aequorivita antarctica TaxID=153266 RepID=A0A5C6Z0Y6_9FLAO|nr:type II toxin-antitoxin system HipA family toxin [Aequorivita antarctica]TXD73332.1 type II toxin-antitoxin system HipA family toxin [Aequorivita antarctica]SRX76445.1 Serine/threonine-protein kinase HipA [Aequorivita antarctica]
MLVQVSLYGESLGTVDWNEQKGSAIFQYSENSYTNTREPSPLLMPKEGRTYETNRDHINFHDLPYLLSDSMPDDFGNIMMKEWLRQKSLSYDDINPVDRLTYVGKRGMGALEYEPINHNSSTNYSIDVTELLEVAKNVLEGKEELKYKGLNEESLTEILRIGTSVGGARAKALLAIKEDEKGKIIEIKPGDILQPNGYTYWLLKMDGANEKTLGESDGVGKIEFAYYKMAIDCGIEMSESRLYNENNRFHFLTKRFDRSELGEKIHMQTLGSLVGVDFKIQKASSYETLFRTMKRLKSNYQQFEQQYRRAIFNIVSRNHDDHVKNFSFLMNKQGEWRISPAYDITYSYKPSGTWTNVHQSSLNGKFDNFNQNDLIEFGKMFGIKNSKLIIKEVIDAVSKWNQVAKEIDIPKKTISKINKDLRLKL